MTRCPGPGCAPSTGCKGLVRRYGADRVEQACSLSLDLDVVSVNKIASMLERPPRTPSRHCRRQSARPLPDSPAIHPNSHPQHIILTIVDDAKPEETVQK